VGAGPGTGAYIFRTGLNLKNPLDPPLWIAMAEPTSTDRYWVDQPVGMPPMPDGIAQAAEVSTRINPLNPASQLNNFSIVADSQNAFVVYVAGDTQPSITAGNLLIPSHNSV